MLMLKERGQYEDTTIKPSIPNYIPWRLCTAFCPGIAAKKQ